MTSELTKRPSSQVPAMGAAMEGMDEVRPEEIKVPRLIMRQGTSKDVPDDVKLGNWFARTVNRDYGPRVGFLPIAKFNSRVYFKKGDPMVQCSSLDARVPVLREGMDEATSPEDPNGAIYQECGNCFFAQWQPNPEQPAKNYQPCAAQINFLGFAIPLDGDEADRQLCIVTFKRKSWKAGSQIVTMLATSGAPSVSHFALQLSTVVEQGPMSKYAVAMAQSLGPAAKKWPGASEACRPFRDAWAKMRVHAAEATVAEADDDEDKAAAEVAPPPAAKKHAAEKPRVTTGPEKDDDLPF